MIEFNNEVYDLSISGLRKSLHSELDSLFWETYSDTEDTEELEAELQQAHDMISAQDLNGLGNFLIGYGELPSFNLVSTDTLLADALTSAGYKVESSHISRSLYVINDDGVEVRIADHKRPGYQVAGQVDYATHEYSNEIIISDNTVEQWQLDRHGICLPNDSYLLG